MRPTSMWFSYLLAHAERAAAQMYDKQRCSLTKPFLIDTFVSLFPKKNYFLISQFSQRDRLIQY
jgi:hypothetical protein